MAEDFEKRNGKIAAHCGIQYVQPYHLESPMPADRMASWTSGSTTPENPLHSNPAGRVSLRLEISASWVRVPELTGRLPGDRLLAREEFAVDALAGMTIPEAYVSKVERHSVGPTRGASLALLGEVN